MTYFGLNDRFLPQSGQKGRKRGSKNDPKRPQTWSTRPTNDAKTAPKWCRFFKQNKWFIAKKNSCFAFCTIFDYYLWILAEICIFLPSLRLFFLILQLTSQNTTKKTMIVKTAQKRLKWPRNCPKIAQKGFKKAQNEDKNDTKTSPEWF